MHNILKVTLVLLLVGCTTPNSTKDMKTTEVTPQSMQDSLHSSLDTYFIYTKELNVNKILDMIYYRVYDVMPKSKMQEMFDQIFHSPNVPKLIKAHYAKNVKIKKYTNGYYAIVPWDADMTMPTKTTDIKKEKFMVKMMGIMMKNTIVTLDSKAHILHLKTKDKTMLAIKENGKKWEFVADQMAKKFKIIPKEIEDEL